MPFKGSKITHIFNIIILWNIKKNNSYVITILIKIWTHTGAPEKNVKFVHHFTQFSMAFWSVLICLPFRFDYFGFVLFCSLHLRSKIYVYVVDLKVALSFTFYLLLFRFCLKFKDTLLIKWRHLGCKF